MLSLVVAMALQGTAIPMSLAGDAPFINSWLTCGPFENGPDSQGFRRPWFDEEKIEPREGMHSGGEQWRYFDDRLFSRNLDDYQDLFSDLTVNRRLPAGDRVVYAHTWVHAQTPVTAQLRVGADSACRAWLNGKCVLDEENSGSTRDAWTKPAELDAGWNRLLLKVANRKQGRLGFYARVAMADGSAVSGLTVAASRRGRPALGNAVAIDTRCLPGAYRSWPYFGVDARGTDSGWGPLSRPDLAMRCSPFVLDAAGGQPPYRWALTGGRLPEGLELTSDGRLSGTVSEACPLGERRFDVLVTDSSGGKVSASLTINVDERPSRWFEEARLSALIHSPESLPAGDFDAFAALMKRQGYGIGMPISYNNGDHKYRWPSRFAPDADDLVARYKRALEGAGLRFGMYIGNFDGDNHDGFDGALLVLADVMQRYKPAAIWFDWAGWHGSSLDALYSVIRSTSPETLIILNGMPTMCNGDWDVVVLEAWGAWGDRIWDLWPAPAGWPKRAVVESWRFVADPRFEHTAGIVPDWQEYLRVQISLIGDGFVANIDHSPVIRQKLERFTDSVLMKCHQRMANWANPPGLEPLVPSYTQVNPGPLVNGTWGYNVISVDRRHLYLHMIRNPLGKTGLPERRSLQVGPVHARVTGVTWMNRGRGLRFSQTERALGIDLDGVEADPVDTILRVDFEAPYPAFEVPASRPTAVPPGNLATGRPSRLLNASAAATLQPSAFHFARYGNDGLRATWAQAGGEWAWTYAVDLEKTMDVSRVVIHFGPGFATEYEVLVSVDGRKWLVVESVTGSTGGTREHRFRQEQARFVGICARKPDAPNQPGVQMSISELEVY